MLNPSKWCCLQNFRFPLKLEQFIKQNFRLTSKFQEISPKFYFWVQNFISIRSFFHNPLSIPVPELLLQSILCSFVIKQTFHLFRLIRKSKNRTKNKETQKPEIINLCWIIVFFCVCLVRSRHFADWSLEIHSSDFSLSVFNVVQYHWTFVFPPPLISTVVFLLTIFPSFRIYFRVVELICLNER